MARDSLSAIIEEDRSCVTISVNGDKGFFIDCDLKEYTTEYLTFYDGLEYFLAPKPLVEWSN